MPNLCPFGSVSVRVYHHDKWEFSISWVLVWGPPLLEISVRFGRDWARDAQIVRYAPFVLYCCSCQDFFSFQSKS